MVNDSIDNLRLDINKPKARVSLSVRKGDTKTRTIHVSLTSNGAVYSLENVLIAELLINKPDGKVCDQDMVIKGNELQYTFRTQDTNVEGECVCQIRLMFKDGAYLVSPEFYMYVYNMILDNKTSKSENEYSHTDELLVKANEYYENAETLSKQVEDAVTEASGYADTAEGFKDDAETAKTAAETAQTAAETAKTGAETAKTGAETAKAGAEAALASAQAIDTNVSTLKATCLQAVTDCKAEVVNAQTEVTNATNQATLAAASAVAAATSATNAATSEGNALNYAQDALNSELHAKGFKDDAEAAKNDLESKLITATNTNAGIVKPDGVSITVAADGTISASGSGAIASTTTLGSVKVDGTTITADPDGTIHGATTTPIATTTTEGTVKPDGTTITVLADGTISAVDTTPIATTTAVGTVKADGTTITVAADGTISSTGTTSPIATTSTAGIVIPDGTTITVDSLGKISAVDATPIATTTTEGTVKPDGTTITVLADGTISAVDQTPIATTSVAGTVIPDGTTITVDASGNISAVDQTPIATTSVAGSVIPDGTTITVDASGNISAVQQEADDVTYDNTTSGLTATDVQDAIDEVNTALGTKLDATDYKKTVSSVNGTNIHITDSVESNMVLNDAVVNLLPNNATTHTMNGVTFTVNSDGSVTANGTASDWADIIRCEKLLKKGTYCYSGSLSENYYLVVRKSSDSSILLNLGETVFTLDTDTTCKLMVYVKIGQTVNNETLYPMLEKGTVAHSYVPPMYDITSCGKNLINNNFTVGSKSGITCTLNSDKTYTISGNASATTGNNFYVDISGLKSTNSYIISGCPSGGSDTTYRLRVFGGLQGSSGMASDLGSGTTVTGYDSYRLAIQIIQTGVDINLVFKPMLRLASDTDDTYEPYQSSKVTVSSDTVFPLNGLKSFNGITNVFNDYNADMEVVYANDNVGASVLDNAWKLECDNAQNLLNTINYVWQTKEDTLTVINNADGSLTFNGTTKKNNSIKYTLQFKKGTYTISGCPKTGSNTTYRMTVTDGTTVLAYDFGYGATFTLNSDTTIYVYIDIRSSYSPSNLTFYPMLEKGTIAHSYKPYKDCYVTNGNVNSLTDTTVNLLNPTYGSTVKEGITIVKNSDNSYTLNGKNETGNRLDITFEYQTTYKQGTYKLVGMPKSGTTGDTSLLAMIFNGDTWVRDYIDYGDGIVFTSNNNRIAVVFVLQVGAEVTNAVIKPMITTNLNATYDDYVPYTGDTGKLNSDVAEIRHITWNTLTLSNVESGIMYYCKDSFGFVHVRLNVKLTNTLTYLSIGTLPSGYRPLETCNYKFSSGDSAGTQFNLTVGGDGNIVAYAISYSWTYGYCEFSFYTGF